MTTSTLNKMSILYILLIVLFVIFYPGYYDENLQKEILAKKESKMLEWLEMFNLKLEEQNIISGIKKKSDQEIKNEKEKLKTKELKDRAKKIGEIKQLLNAGEKTVNRLSRLENNPDKTQIENTIKKLKNKIDEIENMPLPDVYKYSNVAQLINYLEYSPYDISFWKINNIDLLDLRKMFVEDAKAYLLQNAVFIKILDRDIEDKNSFSVKPGDEGQRFLVNAFSTDGQKVLPPQNWQFGSLQLMKLLTPEDAQICLLIQETNLHDYHNNISDFYSFIGGLMAFLILLSPFFYIIFEHAIKNKSSSAVDFYHSNIILSPSIWQVIRGDELSSRFIYFVPVLSPILIMFAAGLTSSMEGIQYVVVPIAILISALGTLPISMKTMKVRRLFRMGIEVDCVFLAEDDIYTGQWSAVNSVNIYAYEFNGNVYIIKERQLPNQKNFVLGKTKLTVLIDPAKPKKAIIKENYIKLY